eukprot:3868620-Rhodomonas_salina.1
MGLSPHLIVGVLCVFLSAEHVGAAPVSKQVFEVPPITDGPANGKWSQPQNINGEPAAVLLTGAFGYSSNSVLRIDANGVTTKHFPAWDAPNEFAACSDALIGFNRNSDEVSVFEDSCATDLWTEESENGIFSVDIGDGTGGQTCGLTACVGEKLYVGTTSSHTYDDPENGPTQTNGGFSYLQHINVATGEVVSFQNPATMQRIPFACNTNFGDVMQVIGGKLVFASCCVLNALDPTTLEVREVLQHCNCSNLPYLPFQDGPGTCSVYDYSTCPVPSLRASVSNGFLMLGYQSS